MPKSKLIYASKRSMWSCRPRLRRYVGLNSDVVDKRIFGGDLSVSYDFFEKIMKFPKWTP